MNRPVILLTNDDGIASPGLAAAAEALLPLGRVVVAAPIKQQTSMSRSYTGSPEARLEPYPLTVAGEEVEAYSMDATPAAVVRHTVLAMPRLNPSLVVAGVNYGENIGLNVTASGTVGATMEAASRGFPALAMSLETSIDTQREYTIQDWSGSIHFTRLFAAQILRRGMPAGVGILKVEVPAGATEATPWRMTRLSPFAYYEPRIDNPCLDSCRRDMVFSKRDGIGEPSDTDAYVVRTARAVAITPLTLDITANTPLNVVAAWAEN